MSQSTKDVRGEMGSGPFKGRGRIEDVVHELRRQADARSDFVMDTRDLVLAPSDSGEPRLFARGDSGRDFLPREGLPLLDQAFVQVGSRAAPGGVPIRFLRRVWDANRTRTAEFVNGLMHDDPQRRLVRVLDNKVRAFLSQSYRCIDNLDIAQKALNVAIDSGAQPIEASVTDSHMRIRLVSREIAESLQRVRDASSGHSWYAGGLGRQSDLNKVAARSWGDLPGDTIHPALGFSNSETGHGGCDLDGGIMLGVCFNLAWVRRMVHEIHLGERLDEGVFSADTARKHADLIYAKIGDAVDSYFDRDAFEALVAGYDETQRRILRAPSVACRVAIEASPALAEGDLDSLISFFAEQPGDRCEFNLGQAVSRLAQEHSPNQAVDLESFAHDICAGKLTQQIVKAEDRYIATFAGRD